MTVMTNPGGLLLSRLQELQTYRHPWEADWNDIRDYVRVHAKSYGSSAGFPVQPRQRYLKAYDSTAPESLTQFAAALHSFLTNPVDRWFDLTIEGLQIEDMTKPEKVWLNDVADIIYSEFSRPSVNFNSAIHELFLDLGAFGTGVICQEYNYDDRHIIFKGDTILTSWVAENSDGVVDTLFRKTSMSQSKIVHQFPATVGLKDIGEAQPTQLFSVIHACVPRRDYRHYGTIFSDIDRAFASAWMIEEGGHIVDLGGYDSFPYHVTRWIKAADEAYGSGPAAECLPDVRTLNAMDRTVLKAAQKAADPPLVLENDAFTIPIATSPGAVIFKEHGADNPYPLEHRGNFPVSFEMMKDKRDRIKRCFHDDWIRMEKQNVEMTAYEVADRREEKLRLLAPMLGRQHSELLGPLISRAYLLLSKVDRIPRAPESLRGHRMKIVYVSPAAKAQTGIKAFTASRFMQEIIPLAQAHPEILDVIDLDAWAQKLATLRGVDPEVIREPVVIAAMRQQRAQMQQLQQAAEIAEPASQALKNVAQANQMSGGNIVPLP